MSTPIIFLCVFLYFLIGFVINVIVDAVDELGVEETYLMIVLFWPVMFVVAIFYVIFYVALPKSTKYFSNLISRKIRRNIGPIRQQAQPTQPTVSHNGYTNTMFDETSSFYRQFHKNTHYAETTYKQSEPKDVKQPEPKEKEPKDEKPEDLCT